MCLPRIGLFLPVRHLRPHRQVYRRGHRRLKLDTAVPKPSFHQGSMERASRHLMRRKLRPHLVLAHPVLGLQQVPPERHHHFLLGFSNRAMEMVAE